MQSTLSDTGGGRSIEADKLRFKPVCTFCKRRKIKCDRQIPCSSCLKFGNKECVYIEPAPKLGKKRVLKPSKRSLELEIDSLKKYITQIQKSSGIVNGNVLNEMYNMEDADNQLYEDDFADLMKLVEDTDCDDAFKQFKSFSGIIDNGFIGRRNFGTFSWKTFGLVDPAMTLLGNHTKSLYKEGKGPFASAQEEQPQYDQRLKTHLTQNVTPFAQKPEDSSVEQKESRVLPGIRPTMLFNTTEDSAENQVKLKQKIEAFLPPRYIMKKYMNLFFKRIYQVMPIVDQGEFLSAMYRIMQNTAHEEKPSNLNIVDKTDFARLGMLLLMMRMSYLSLIPLNPLSMGSTNPNNYSPDEIDDMSLLLKYPINLDAVVLAQECLYLFNLFGILNLTVFQLLLVTRVYFIYGPEQGDGPDHGDAQLFNSILFQIAYSLGLHRDPDNTSIFTDEKTKNLVRKMWTLLLLLDLTHSLEFGDPLNLNKYSYDTKLPVYKTELSNLMDHEHEKTVIECFQFLGVCFKPLTGFITDLTSVNAQFSITKLCKQLRYLRTAVFGPGGIYQRPFSPGDKAEIVVNITKYKTQLHFSQFICSLYFFLYNFLEKKGLYDVAFYYLINMLTKVLLVLFPFYFEVANLNNVELTIDFVLVPGVQSMLHKSMIVMIAMLAKIKIQILNQTNDAKHSVMMKTSKKYESDFKHLCTLFDKLDNVVEALVTIADIYSKKYYYSWMISRMNRFFMKLIKSPDFAEKIYKPGYEFPIFMDDNKVLKLIEVLDLCLDTKSRLSSFKPAPKTTVTGSETGSHLAGNTWSNEYHSGDSSGSSSKSTSASHMGEDNGPNGPAYQDNTTPFSFSPETLDGMGISSYEVDNMWLQLLGIRDETTDGLLYDVPHAAFAFGDGMSPYATPDLMGVGTGFTPRPSTATEQNTGLDAFVLEELFRGVN